MDWSGLYNTSKLVTRLMDNVLDSMDYPDSRYEDNSKKYRQIGIGPMGIADAMFELDIKYDSAKGKEFAGEIMNTITCGSIDCSVELAEEKGTFHDYDSFKEDMEYVVENLCGDGDIMKKVRESGLRNSAHTTAQPTGCLVGDIFISAKNKGLIKIKDGKQLIDKSTKSDNGNNTYKNWYNQGFKETIKITTIKGYEIQGTLDHKIRVYNKNGYIWKKLSDINNKDNVVLKKGFMSEGIEDVKLAEIIGYYMADGWFHNGTECKRGGRLYFSINKKEKDYVYGLIENLKMIYKDFNVFERKYNNSKKCIKLDIASKDIYEWFKEMKCVKNGASSAFIPSIIMKSNRKSILKFIKGYFMGDGCIINRDKKILFTTVSKRMAKDLSTLLLGIGYPSSITEYLVKNGDTINIGNRKVNKNHNVFKVYISKYYSSLIAKELNIDIENFDCNNRERVPLEEHEYGMGNSFVMYHTKNKYIYKKSNNGLVYTTFDKYKQFVEDGNTPNKFWKNDLFIDKVRKVEKCEIVNVYDMEIKEDGHTYIANGFVTHNTTAISCDASYGIEPCFGLVFQKNLIDGSKMRFVNKVFESKFRSEKWYTDDLLDKIFQNGGSLKGIRGIPEDVRKIFVTAHDIKPKDRIDVQASIQKHCSTAISSTINLPKETTKEEISDLYKYAYEKELKGITVYRDGSKKGQPVTFKPDKEATNSEFKRPTRLSADVFRVETGNGSLYVTISANESRPIELFLQIGKSGQILNTLSEALGRVISIALQGGVPVDNIVKTLIGINSDRPVWSRLDEKDEKPVQILSVPDGIAQLLDKFYGGGRYNGADIETEKCPKCGLPVLMIEGCTSCTCGYSKCG